MYKLYKTNARWRSVSTSLPNIPGVSQIWFWLTLVTEKTLKFKFEESLLPFGHFSSLLLTKNVTIKPNQPIILTGFYTYKTLTITLGPRTKIRVFENSVSRRILGSKWQEVKGKRRRLHNEEDGKGEPYSTQGRDDKCIQYINLNWREKPPYLKHASLDATKWK
jgi:hypothetical protein